MIRFSFVHGNFLEDPSVNQVFDVGILIKDYPHSQHISSQTSTET